MPEPFVISRFRHSSMMDQNRKGMLCAKCIHYFEESFFFSSSQVCPNLASHRALKKSLSDLI